MYQPLVSSLPPDETHLTWDSSFRGADEPKRMAHILVPEPSLALLGLCGLTLLLSRRRDGLPAPG
jgi:hypothetical protein